MKRVNPALIGGFILVALVLVVAGVVILGSGKFLTPTLRCVMYFQGAVQGLNVGSSVNFRGVKVGTVKSVRLQIDHGNLEVRIPVVVDFPIDPQTRRIEMMGEGARPPREVVENLIMRGLHGQLQTESFVTGQLFIQLDLYPDEVPGTPRTDRVTNLLEIPTVPTILQEASDTLRQALNKLTDLHLEEIVRLLEKTLAGTEQLVNSPEIPAALRNINGTLTETQRLVQRFDAEFGQVTASATTTLGSMHKLTIDAQNLVRDAQKLVRQADTEVGRVATSMTTVFGVVGKLTQHTDEQLLALLTSLRETSHAVVRTLTHSQETLTAVQATLNIAQAFLAPHMPVGYELAKALREMADAARAVRLLADYLERHPSSIVFGKNPTKGQ